MAMAKSAAPPRSPPGAPGGLFGACGPSILFDDDYSAQKEVINKKQDFDEAEATSEYMETHYFKQTDSSGSERLVKLN